MQVPEHASARDIFSEDYIYYSSIATSWVEHARVYVSMISRRLSLGPSSKVIEIACNDGYLLQHFKALAIPCLGVEPSRRVAISARKKGFKVITGFFGRALARKLAAREGTADLIVANNVLAHVPDINDFTAGLAIAVKAGGVVTLEFPHLLQLIANGQFDTIYHEHFSYFTLATATRILAAHGLEVFDVEELETHGGSLRVFAKRRSGKLVVSPRVSRILAKEKTAKLDSLEGYRGFQDKADKIKNDLLTFLIEQKRKGKSVLAYAAAAKGNTLLNYAGVRPDLLSFVADASPHKKGKFLPGSRIPVVSEEELRAARPDFVLMLAWNLRTELSQQLSYIGDWGGRLVVAIPRLEMFDP